MALSMVAIGAKSNGKSAWLDAPAAESYKRMLAAGCPAGGITDAGRTNAEQWEMWQLYLAGKLKATAAYPGTSKHETGRALDLDDGALAWVRAWGKPFGWIPDRVANEPWHLEYEVDKDQQTKTRSATATPVAPEEDDMPVIIVQPERGHWLVGLGYAKKLTTEWNDAVGPYLRDPGHYKVIPVPGGAAGQTVFDKLIAAHTQNHYPAIDVNGLIAAVAEAIPASSGGPSLDQITQAVKAAIDGATLTVA